MTIDNHDDHGDGDDGDDDAEASGGEEQGSTSSPMVINCCTFLFVILSLFLVDGWLILSALFT